MTQEGFDMSYHVKDYMTREVVTTDCDATVSEAAKIMAADKEFEGYVIVLEKGKPVGILTERDIISKVVAKDLDPSKIKASEVMSSPLVTIGPDEDLLKASDLMRQSNIHKLVVVKDNIIYGVITSRLIARRASDYVDRSVRDIIRWTAPLGM